MMKFNQASPLLLGVLLGLSACGPFELNLTNDINNDDVKTTFATVRVQVGQLGTSAVSAAPGAKNFAATSAHYAATASSATAYAYAHLEGFRIWIDKITLESDSGGFEIVSWEEEPYLIELTGTDNAAFVLNAQYKVANGDYEATKVHIRNKYEVKGFCRTQNGYVYTTAGGAKFVDNLDTMPGDYDYLAYGEGDESNWQIAPYAFTITDTADNRLALLVDTAYVVSCFDGTAAQAGQGAIDPFNFDTSFAADAPNFGLGNLQIFAIFNEDENEGLPTAETYVAHPDATVFDADSLDYWSTYILTVVFRDNGSIVGAMGRPGGAAAGLIPWYLGFEATADDTHTLKLGGWLCNADESECIDDGNHRDVTGFKRLTNFTDVHETSVVDGPDCQTGDAISSDRTGCLDEPYALFWRRVER
jgi:hypothetical protein